MSIGLWIASDVHDELIQPADRPTFARPPGADLLLLAGDQHHAAKAIDSARRMFGVDIPIVMIAGNHEHYGRLLPVKRNHDRLREDARHDRKKGRETYFLENETATLTVRGQAIRFVGATFWTDFGLLGDPLRAKVEAVRGLNDFNYVLSNQGGDDGPWVGKPSVEPDEMIRWHVKARSYIARKLVEPFDGRTVVMTHHVPSLQSVAQRWRGHPLTPCFASCADDLIALGSDLWVHGHTHDSADWTHEGGTRVVCNPRGYQRKTKAGQARSDNQEFDAALVILL